jgi:hypothetical protein
MEVDVVSSEIQRFVQKHEKRLHHHEKAEAIQLLDSAQTPEEKNLFVS